MSRELDERIVAMYFDNSDFEKNAQQTIETLNELKESCNMKGVEKGFEAFEKIGKVLNFEKLNKGAKTLKNTISTIGTGIKKAFSLTPIDNLYRSLKNFENKYFDRVIGFNIAHKLEAGLENMIRSLTVEPISAGWKQYETTIDSVKTIVSSTGETVDVVKEKLGHLTDYANKTIYSLSDMVSNIGKFTNNAVGLDDATDAMIGLANATAIAGQGAQQASAAMYNVSQAIGVGKMLTVDWKSLENAGIAGKKLKDVFRQAAAAHGTLEKRVEKDAKTGEEVVKYFTKAEKGAEAMEVGIDNFRDTLSKGWLDKTAMMDTFKIFSGQYTADQIASMLGVSAQESAMLYQIGQDAMQAAQEVRTFSKMMDALREGVQSTWATSFEYIFGDIQEATKLWTDVNNKIEAVLNKSSEARNNILMAWRGKAEDRNGVVKSIKEIYETEKELAERDLEFEKANAKGAFWRQGYTPTAAEKEEAEKKRQQIIAEAEEKYRQRIAEIEEKYGNPESWIDYRQVAIEALLGVQDEEGNLIKKGLFQVIQDLAGAIKDSFNEVFGSFDAESLKSITQKFADFVERLKVWLGDISDENSRISKIKTIFTGFFSAVKLGIDAMKTAFSTIWEIVKPFIDPIIDLTVRVAKMFDTKGAKNFGEQIKKIVKNFRDLWDKAKQLGLSGIMGKIGDSISSAWESAKAGIRGWLEDNGLSGVTDWFVKLGDNIKAGYESVRDWWNDPTNGISSFFREMWNTVTGWFKPGANGEDVPIVAFFKNIYDWITGAWNSVATSLEGWWKGGDNEVAKFFTTMWETISGWFTLGENGGDIPIVAFFMNIYTWIKNAWESVVSNLRRWWDGGDNDVARFFIGMWDKITVWFTPGEGGGDVPIVAFFKNIYTWIKTAWESVAGDLKRWWDGGDNDVARFFTSMWNKIKEWFTPGENGEDLPIVAFFKKIYDWIKNAWESTISGLEGWWKGGDNDVAHFFIGMWDNIKSWFTPGDNGEDIPIVAFFKKIYDWITEAWDSVYEPLKSWWEGAGVADFFKGIWDEVMAAFGSGEQSGETGIDPDKKAPIVEWFEQLSSDLKAVWDSIIGWQGWESVGQFFSDIWNWVIGLFNGDKSVVGGAEEAAVAIKDGGKKAEALKESQGFFEQIGGFFAGLFTSFSESVTAIGSVPEAKAIMTTISDIIEIVSTVVQTVTDWLGRITGTDNQKAEWPDYVVPALIGIVAIALEVYKYKKASNLAKIAEAGGFMTNIGGELLKIAAGIALLAVAVRFLGSLPTDQLIKGGATMAVLGTVIIFLINGMNNMNKTLNKRIMPETSAERIAKHAITAVTIAGTIAEVMALLPNILDKLQGFGPDVNGDAIFKTFSGIAIMVSSLILSIAVFNKLGGGQMSVAAAAKSALGIVVGVGILLLGFEAIIDAVFGIQQLAGDEYTNKRVEMLQAGAKVLAATGEAIGGFLGAIGGGIAGGFDAAKGNRMADGAKSASEILKDVSVEDMQHMADVVGILTDIQEAIPDYDDIWDKWLNGDKLGMLGDNVARLGKGLGEMVLAINPSELDPENDIGRLKEYIDFLNAFGGVADILSRTVDTIGRFFGSNAYYNPDLLSENNMFAIVMAYYREAAELLAEAIQDGLGDEENLGSMQFDFDPTGIITAICKSLETQGRDDVAKAVAAMIQAGLNGYASVDEFGNTQIHSTQQINDALTNIFDLMNQGGASTDLSGILTSFLGDLGDQSKLNSMLGQFSGIFDTFGSTISDKINGSINLDIGKWFETDDQGNIPALSNFETEWESALEKIKTENPDAFELQIRPVISMDDFGTEMTKLQTYFAGQLPLSMNASVALGEQKLPIDDTNIVSELKLLKTELINTRTSLSTTIDNVSISLGSRITSLGRDVASMRLYLDGNTLVGYVDSALYNRGWHSQYTGVSNTKSFHAVVKP